MKQNERKISKVCDREAGALDTLIAVIVTAARPGKSALKKPGKRAGNFTGTRVPGPPNVQYKATGIIW